ncbi:hypothetical protein, partial [uncultured Corynebacterium sp.]|uniref:hypothetical protein n=1 Tax=uncultured Corynebacterium sp. TaxID=159447 RepID=UPI0025E172A1
AYPAPVAAPERPPIGSISTSFESLVGVDGGELLTVTTRYGDRLHLFREGLFRWSTRTADWIVVEAGTAPGPATRRLWVRHPDNRTWWTDSAVCRRVD